MNQALKEQLEKELSFKAVRSSGAGGQHVNKTSSKVELTFNLPESNVLTEEQIQRLSEQLSSRLTKDGLLYLQCEETRSQHKNKALVIERFFDVIEDGLTIPVQRKKTKVPRAVKMKRLKKKRIKSDKKANRRPPELP